MPTVLSSLETAVRNAFNQAGLPGVCQLVAEQEARIATLTARIEELEKRLNKNSSNSGKPPSSDGLRRKTKSRRTKSGRKPGGQPGHPGSALKQRDNPDIVVGLPLTACPECHGDLSAVEVLDTRARQVFDLPPLSLQVTEYRAEGKSCPHCQAAVCAGFPHGVDAPAQYGPRLRAFVTYLNIRHMIPCDRISELIRDLVQQGPGAGSVHNIVKQCAEILEAPVEEIRRALREAEVLHADETGVRCGGRTRWLHVVCNSGATVYSLGPGRGFDGFASGGILYSFTGTLVHDFFGPYEKLECLHARCNVHLDRELVSCIESGCQWAGALRGLVYEMKDQAELARDSGQGTVPEPVRERLLERYRGIVSEGLEKHPVRERPPDHRRPGRISQSPETNLLLRLRDHEDEVLRFFHDPSVPFDNNQAERDIRMVKVQQKVSGCFRTASGAEDYCTIASFVSTLRKQGSAVVESLCKGFSGLTIRIWT